MDYFRTFTRPSPSRNLTFDKDTADLLANLSLDKDDDWKNQTFTRKRLSRDSSEGFDYDDHGSVNSDNSTSHRLNDVGDVQTLARLQEESKYFVLNISNDDDESVLMEFAPEVEILKSYKSSLDPFGFHTNLDTWWDAMGAYLDIKFEMIYIVTIFVGSKLQFGQLKNS